MSRSPFIQLVLFPDPEWEVRQGLTRATDEKYTSLRLGPILLIWGDQR